MQKIDGQSSRRFFTFMAEQQQQKKPFPSCDCSSWKPSKLFPIKANDESGEIWGWNPHQNVSYKTWNQTDWAKTISFSKIL